MKRPTKPTGESTGLGLGLSIGYDIVTRQHGGAITVSGMPGEFTEFTVRLPGSPIGEARRGCAGAGRRPVGTVHLG